MNNPPKPILRFLRWFCHPDLLPSIEGDLLELYQERIANGQKQKANWLFTWDVVKLFRPSIIGFTGRTHRLNGIGMLRNYIKVGVRNIAKHRLFSVLNIVGLSIGMSVTLLIVVLLTNVMNFDNFQVNRDRIRRVYTEETNENGKSTWAVTFPQLANELGANETVEEVLKINRGFGGQVTYNSREFSSTGFFADRNFFDVFSYELLVGNANEALKNPYSVVLTESIAEKLFRDADPYGKTLTTKFGDFIVTGVIRQPTENSHLAFEMLGSYATLSSLEKKVRS